MALLLTLVRLLAFAVSTMGYVALVRIYWKVPARASYLFVLASIACLEYLSGLVGVLPLMAVLLFFGGLFSLTLIVLKKKFRLAFNRSSLSALNLAFFAGLIALVTSLIDTKFVHYDNFSHWAVVVKNMLITNHFPDAYSAIIDFKSYPLGSSSFLYYFCGVVGSEEGVMLTGQILLLFACFYAMFGVIRDVKRFLLVGLLGLCCSTMAYFNISIRVNNLLVDFLLPALALGACRHHHLGAKALFRRVLYGAARARAAGYRKIHRRLLCRAVLRVFATSARHSAAPRGSRRCNGFIRPALAVIVLSLVTLVLWNIHTASAFAGDTSKFSYDLQNLSGLQIDKTPEQIRAISTLFLQTAVSLRGIARAGDSHLQRARARGLSCRAVCAA